MPSIEVRFSNFMLKGFFSQSHVMLPRPRSDTAVSGRSSNTPLPSMRMVACFHSSFDVMSLPIGLSPVDELIYTTGSPVKLTTRTVYSYRPPSPSATYFTSPVKSFGVTPLCCSTPLTVTLPEAMKVATRPLTSTTSGVRTLNVDDASS